MERKKELYELRIDRLVEPERKGGAYDAALFGNTRRFVVLSKLGQGRVTDVEHYESRLTLVPYAE